MKLLEEYKEFNNETYQKVIFQELFRQDYLLSKLGGEIALKGKEVEYVDQFGPIKEDIPPGGVVCYMKPKDIMHLALKYSN